MVSVLLVFQIPYSERSLQPSATGSLLPSAQAPKPPGTELASDCGRTQVLPVLRAEFTELLRG
jgi:hypothetical protein